MQRNAYVSVYLPFSTMTCSNRHDEVVYYMVNIQLGVGFSCVAYLYMEAMRKPEYRDRHGGENSHAFFVFSIHNLLMWLTSGVCKPGRLKVEHQCKAGTIFHMTVS